jgi:D-glycero-D-manno-heptose 1,7-bisphosphate phosphatase
MTNSKEKKNGAVAALFLDRDGVINVEKDYLYKIEDFEFIDGIFELCKKYQEMGYLIIVVTNQSGIARGYYNEDDLPL